MESKITNTLVKLLLENKKTLSVAESFTGGYISQLLTKKSGASKFFIGSIVCYNERIKIKELQVSEELIKKYSVISSQVSEAMAIGIQKKFNSDFSIATTGNAGPVSDKTDKKIGVVYIAISTPKDVFSEEFDFGIHRQKVIEKGSNKALEILRDKILKTI